MSRLRFKWIELLVIIALGFYVAWLLGISTKFQKLQQELQQREAELMQKLESKVVNVINKIGDRDAYDMILRVQPGVLYRKRHRDITDEVVKLYTQHYGSK